MTKLCPRGKAAAKRKFKVYPGIAKGCGALMASKRKKTKRPKQRRAVA